MELSKEYIILKFIKNGLLDNYYGNLIYILGDFILEYSNEGYKFYKINDKSNYTQDIFFKKYREELLNLC
jgi:predicted transcriptional regulator with HTH domain